MEQDRGRVPVAEALLGRLSRRTSRGLFIPEIDGLRFVAIAMVVLAHVANFGFAHAPAGRAPAPNDRLLNLLQQGGFGVEVFFVISGFVLALPFARWRLLGADRIELRSYFLRRLTRLEPPYLISLTLIMIAVALTTGPGLRALAPHFVAGALYAHNLVYDQFNTINWVAWSLEIEIQFYVLVPLLTLVFLIDRTVLRRSVIVAASLAAIGLQTTFHGDASRLSLTVFGFAQFFLAGFLLADLYLTSWGERPSTNAWWDALWVIGWVLISVLLRTPHGRWAVPFITLAIFAAAFRGPFVRRFLTNRWIFTIGGMCYSIYLLHVPLIRGLANLTGPAISTNVFAVNVAMQTVLLVPVVLAVCALFFVFIERPCMNKRWPQDLRRRLTRGSGQIARGSEPSG